jgi:hypothetical protein
MSSPTELRAFLFWGVAFAVLTLGAISSLAIVLLPLGVGLLVWGGRQVATGPALLGGLAGPAVVLLLIGLLHLGDVPCSTAPVRLRPGERFSCSDFNVRPWFLTGTVLLFVSIASYAVARRRAA